MSINNHKRNNQHKDHLKLFAWKKNKKTQSEILELEHKSKVVEYVTVSD